MCHKPSKGLFLKETIQKPDNKNFWNLMKKAKILIEKLN